MVITKEIKFTKMHGAGNDYIYVDATSTPITDLPDLARHISSRHFGVGSDGLVVILSSEIADFRMRMFNADGSEAQMCGNASRCIGKFVFEKGLTDKRTITLETLAGVKTLQLHVENGEVTAVTVDMGRPILKPRAIPVIPESGCVGVNGVFKISANLHGRRMEITPVSMGNPHGVIFIDSTSADITDEWVNGIGPALETAPFFPEKCNIEFAKVLNPREICMRVWERGTGETLACGTGACATVVAAVLNGLTKREVKVHLLGGTLSICWDADNDRVYMTGCATFVADGVYYFKSVVEEHRQ